MHSDNKNEQQIRRRHLYIVHKNTNASLIAFSFSKCHREKGGLMNERIHSIKIYIINVMQKKRR